MTGKHGGHGGKYEHITLEDKGKFDPKSFRTVDIGRKDCSKLTVGCPKNHFEDGKCDVGMKAQKVMLEKACFRNMAKEIKKYQ